MQNKNHINKFKVSSPVIPWGHSKPVIIKHDNSVD